MRRGCSRNCGGRILGRNERGSAMSPIVLLVLMAPPTLPPKVGPVPEALRKEWKLSPFYAKHLDLNGFPVLSSAKVSDAGLVEAAYLIDKMLAGRDDVRRALIKNRIRFVVMAPTEMTTDVPEH